MGDGSNFVSTMASLAEKGSTRRSSATSTDG